MSGSNDREELVIGPPTARGGRRGPSPPASPGVAGATPPSSPGPSLGSRRTRIVLLLLLLAACELLVLMRIATTGSSFGGDGAHYYAQVRSLVIDGDLDLANEFRRLHDEVSQFTGNRKLPEIPPTSAATGRPATYFPIGTALLLAPFFAAAHAVASIVAPAGVPPPDGFGLPYAVATGSAAVVYTGLALGLSLGLGRRLGFDRSTAFVGTVGIFVGTPWLYYATLDPVTSHAPAAFAVALFVAILLGPARAGGPWWWLALGASGGLMALVRYQDAAFLLLAPALLVLTWRRGTGSAARAAARLAALAAGCAPFAAAQLAVHRYLYGAFLETGHRSVTHQGFVYWSSPRFHVTALSGESGFLLWSPIVAVGLAGIWALRRWDPVAAALAAAAFLGQWYVTSSWADLAQGDSFGNRHLVSASVFLTVGLGEAVRAAGARWPAVNLDRFRLVALIAIGAGTTLLMALYAFRVIGHPY